MSKSNLHLTQPPSQDDDLAVSAKIRKRLSDSGKRFHANDNIAEFILDGEL